MSVYALIVMRNDSSAAVGCGTDVMKWIILFDFYIRDS